MLFELFNQKKKGHKPIPIDLAARIWLNIFLQFISVPINSLLYKIIFIREYPTDCIFYIKWLKITLGHFQKS